MKGGNSYQQVHVEVHENNPGEHLFTCGLGSLKQLFGIPFSLPTSLSDYFSDEGDRLGSMDHETEKRLLKI